MNQLTRSLSDFAEMLNESGFANIMARFQQDLMKYDQILTEIQDNGLQISSEILEKIKIQETAFNDDETDLFKIENISREQSAVAGPVILAIETASNKTKELLKEESEISHPIASVNQDNDTVVELSTNDTSLTETTTLTTQEDVSEANIETQANTELEENVDQEQSTEPEVNREQTTVPGLNTEQELDTEQELVQDTEQEAEPEQNREPDATEDINNASEEASEVLNNMDNDIDRESDDESVFETPSQTPDLSDIE